ncbi:protein FAR1-RELATED SEQUENCE 5-like [Asparagus officinalis]|uniref:protein FAR1-RELATED SEQUENCE 5-like n=1 Tax=Asparagus officinalis TaxID=4686 RepID=UPI00098E1F56|nr:protein FAR1-RELATED SEQUENCE 5-like [Asparagus officinalis]
MENLDTEANELNLDDDISTYTPQVSDELRPKKGQEFNTIDDVVTFYNAYAKAAGFSVRAWTTQKEPGSGEIRRKEYVCFKQGKSSRIADVGNKRRRGSVAEDCHAKIAVLKLISGKYIVTIFKEEHSHPLSTPSKHQQFSFLGVQSGGIENIGCTQRDLYNHERDIRADSKGHDGQMFYEYLKLEQGKNPGFTFQIEADEEQKITRCFWSDASSRRAYNFFGDVVIFDTTYNTNRYGLIFAPIMGVNNHGQTVVFACGFLNHESVDDFVWLFNKFLESMPRGAPKMIITDQDPTMTKAFPHVLPNTFHRSKCKVCEIVYDKQLDLVSCSCKKFESDGIVCTHIISYLMKFDVEILPDKYILLRWTKSAKSGTVHDDKGMQITPDNPYLLTRSQFIQSSLDLVDKSLVYEETREMFTDGLRIINEQIDQFLSSHMAVMSFTEKSNPICSKIITEGTSAHGSCSYENSFNEPDQVRAKGCGKRLKGGKEKAMTRAKNKKDRRCHGCGKVGQSHDKRNCPALTNPFSTCGDTNLQEGNESSSEDVDLFED